MPHRIHFFASGTTSGLTFASLMEVLRDVNWPNVLTFVGSAVAAGVSLYVQVRAAKREQDRLDREEARQERLQILEDQRLQSVKLVSPSESSTPEKPTS